MSRLSLSLTRQLPRRHIRLSPLSAHLARRCPRVLFYTLLLTHLRLCQFRMCLRYATRHPLCSDGPNITGYLSRSDFSDDTGYTGVFSQTERGSTWSGGSSGHENTWDSPYFSARVANSTYGSSSVVQPASIRMMLCIKI